MTSTLYNMDCRAVLDLFLPENSIDSIVTDPPYELGFMGKAWDRSGISYDVDVWRSALRALKPGGHMLAFGGARTYHRMVCAIEDAGFEIRDQIMWIYGQGMPKSRNGEWGGTALKPAHEPIVVARKPLVGTVEANWLTWGLGALNIDACRIATTDKLGGGDQSTSTKEKIVGWDRPWMHDDEAKAAHATRINKNVAHAEALGRWPANVIHDGSDDVLGAFPDAPGQLANASFTAPSEKSNLVYGRMHREGKPSADSENLGTVGFKMKPGMRRLDTGSAARFFFCAKASKKDRNEGCEHLPNGNNHPTVKPTNLMRYLVRLVTPVGGKVLDLFTGSGSTGKACVLEGFDFVGAENDAGHFAIAQARIANARRVA